MRKVGKKLYAVVGLLAAILLLTVMPMSVRGAERGELEYSYNEADATATVTGISNYRTVTDIVIPAQVEWNGKTYTVTRIAEYALASCPNLLQVDITDSITVIEESAFGACYKLVNVDIPSSVSSIGEYAFYGAANVNYTGSAQGCPWGAVYSNGYVEGDTVYNNSSKTEIIAVARSYEGEYVVADTVTKLYQRAFMDCAAITGITLPDGLTTIEWSAFANCTGLTQIVIPDSVTFMGDHAFSKCSGLAEVKLSEGLAAIGENIFYDCNSIKEIKLPKGITSIGMMAFADCDKLETIVMYDSVTTIAFSAFDWSYNLTTVVMSNAVNETNANWFRDCKDKVTIYALAGSWAESYAADNSLAFKPISALAEKTTLTAAEVVITSLDRNCVEADITVDASFPVGVEYCWSAYNKSTQEEITITDWAIDNLQIGWTPDSFGEYVLTAKARLRDKTDVIVTAQTEAFEFNPYIKGKCQMPYWGEGGGYLIGVESYENPNQSYQYEMLILDCSLLAEGKPAWVYTTNKFTVTEGAAGWCVWQPQYGYYWTLFRVYDADGNMIDQACYPFVNAY